MSCTRRPTPVRPAAGAALFVSIGLLAGCDGAFQAPTAPEQALAPDPAVRAAELATTELSNEPLSGSLDPANALYFLEPLGTTTPDISADGSLLGRVRLDRRKGHGVHE